MKPFLKPLAAVVSALLLAIACAEKPKHTAVRLPDGETVMLVGTASLDSLSNPPFDAWFRPNYEAAQPAPEKINALKPLLEGVQIRVFAATWCKDSRLLVPRLIKVLEQAGYPRQEVEVIVLSREKTTPLHEEEGYDIINVPTLIFYRDGEELNRIVEYAIEDLESDMLKILSGEPYQNPYDWD
ncbi:thioredoxin family protein [Robiginitalea marina]|uniref:Thioredoxin family protein n=1 Tax=Robiginitalea marina TaxID=2954105 RepID=A0ABT1AXP6_9FLAO|nr:thioredoxin family protein [Robiginitalea marina]MCO5724818.1 thioredoxin family protein [Robiginitalea marina]